MRVDASSYSSATAQVIAAAQRQEAFWLCPAGVHTVIEAHRNPLMARAMETANLVTTDGMPLVWSLRWMGIRSQKRVYGPTLTERVLEAAAQQGIPVAFYGTSPETMHRLLGNCRARWPTLEIAYACSPPFRQLTPQEDLDALEGVRTSGAKILFVGLGCPKQERWAQDHYRPLSMPVLAVGAAFDFIAGTKQQAPEWMQGLGLEWLFRLISEPRRLWRRYLFGNPYFVLLLIAQMAGLRRFDREARRPPAD